MDNRTRHNPRLRGDGGAVLIEAALVTPVFLLMIFGLIEYGGAFRDYLTVSNAASGASRRAAIEGSNAAADWEILQALKRQATAMPRNQVVTVVVFKATGPTGGVPDACKLASQAVGTPESPGVGSCNRYTLSELNLATMPSSWETCDGDSPTRFYCPTGRGTAISGAGPDYLGIYVEAVHPFVTGLFGEDITLTSTTVTKLEPTRVA